MNDTTQERSYIWNTHLATNIQSNIDVPIYIQMNMYISTPPRHSTLARNVHFIHVLNVLANERKIYSISRYTNLYSYKYYLKTEFIHAYIYTLWNDIGYYRKFSILARFYIRYINKSLSTLIYFDLDFIKRYFQSFMYKFLLRITVAFVVVIELILIW